MVSIPNVGIGVRIARIKYGYERERERERWGDMHIQCTYNILSDNFRPCRSSRGCYNRYPSGILLEEDILVEDTKVANACKDHIRLFGARVLWGWCPEHVVVR
jgi:hypothetical protein